ncbi:unknown [Singapore grouper iridovirus]|uniref:Uncharacterized protein n=1 Tax=Singapore grouper iridovirus TaxID=262968 RepID=Q5YFE0_9VIRU|nr:hypothetical protein ORF125R [Singapore grouper iridovirus]AAS18140.1 unknown [Singapore grouper iridovirus]WAU86834.1 hypothetical protein ORF125R [Singapore grouper iridovirus]
MFVVVALVFLIVNQANALQFSSDTYDSRHECTSCGDPTNETYGYDVKMQRIQMEGYLTYDFAGLPLGYDNTDWERVMKKGLTIADGTPCVGMCTPYRMSSNNHYCVPKGKVNEWERCALPGRDQYGRWCAEINKDETYGTWCYVKDRNKYGTFSGGQWGYTHPALCFKSQKSCRYNFNDIDVSV